MTKAEKKVLEALMELFEEQGADPLRVLQQQSIWDEIYDVITESVNS